MAQAPSDRDQSTPATEAEIRLAFRQAERLAATNPEEAVRRLQKLVTQVEENTALPEKRRQALKQMLEDRIRVTRLTGWDASAPEEAPMPTKEKPTAEGGELRRLSDALQTARQAGKLPKPDPRATDRATSPATDARRRTTEVADQLAARRGILTDQERGANAALRGVERSAVASGADIEYPANWKARTARRTNINQPRMTARERSIMQALDTPISVKLQNTSFAAAIEYLHTLTGQPIAVDPTALEAANVTYDTPVTLRLPNVSLRTVLRQLLGSLGLTYVVRDEAIQVVTPQQARSMMVTRVYYIGDLITGDSTLFGLGLDDLIAQRNAAYLMELIRSTVNPGGWGGPEGGTMVYDPARRALIVKQSAEFQSVLEGGLR
jgi:hypothetical protein